MGTVVVDRVLLEDLSHRLVDEQWSRSFVRQAQG